tara:strand:+ start:143 stop:433 length:291 start_codon:yes stop_codon:yes gene_type:complete
MLRLPTRGPILQQLLLKDRHVLPLSKVTSVKIAGRVGILRLKILPMASTKKDNMKKELIKFVVDHLKTFKAYPLEFEYKNKVYGYKTIMKIINNRK